MALQWVQSNIAKFGGDPDNVTVFGQSSGGASVGYLLLSQQTKELFHKAISMSGSPLNHWTYSRTPKRFAFALGDALGCHTESEEELLSFLRHVDPKEMVLKSSAIQRLNDHLERHLSLAFVPTAEPADTQHPFITNTPSELIKQGQLHNVPYLLGNVNLEGLVTWASVANKDLVEEDDYFKLIPADITLDRKSPQAAQLVDEIKQFYFPDGYTQEKYVEALSMIYFINGLHNTVAARVSRCSTPTYYYHFVFDGNNPFYKTLLGYNRFQGVCHCDDLAYLFHVNITNRQLKQNSPEDRVVQQLTRLWTDFAKSKDGHVESWKAVTDKEQWYMEIGDVVQWKSGFMQEPTVFWRSLYERYSIS